MQLLIEQILNGLAAGSIYAIVALGLALVYGVMRILHVAHASIYTLGGYIGLYLFQATESLTVAFLGSMLACAIVGVLIERLVYFPLLKFPPYVPLIASIAVMLTIEELCRLVAGPQILTFPAKLPFPDLDVAGVHLSSTLIAVYVITAAILVALWYLINRTELGLAMRATSQDMPVAGAQGINGHLTVSLTFVIGSAIAAIGGILVGIYYNQVYPTMGT
ncbi:MAG TPA: branched-chain amino acid ABC transporter permease, partial [Holophaga sp.]|nr:branched-chain amino acid ABC transporter permease [Holophaga sp.]